MCRLCLGKYSFSFDNFLTYQIPCDAINAKNMAITKTNIEDEKCVENVVNKILIWKFTLMNVNFQIDMPTVVYTRSYDSWKLE